MDLDVQKEILRDKAFMSAFVTTTKLSGPCALSLKYKGGSSSTGRSPSYFFPISSKSLENSLSVEFSISRASSLNLFSNSLSSSLKTKNSSMFKLSSSVVSSDLLTATCSCSVDICLFSNNFMFGNDTKRAERSTTIKHVDGVAFDVEELHINALRHALIDAQYGCCNLKTSEFIVEITGYVTTGESNSMLTIGIFKTIMYIIY
ncbi:hypothetical protein NQ317_001947, partial [Molorchus minor]